ncbi:MAG: cobalamin-dependent protein [Actinomycetota bacterium]|nr:cobalamin-dependent protein [Actinomycetota bacterium]MDD5665848.1 cobalamin-dependent protein [Actinomycetota bacterium]
MSETVFDNLRRAILDYDGDAAEEWARKAVEEKLEPAGAMEVLTDAIRQVGEGFAREELWLPDLVGAAEAFTRAIPVLEERLASMGRERDVLGKVVIGTVAADIHDIGKNMVRIFLTAEGFDVHDLGVNVAAETFLEAVKEHEPDILAMSALLTLTAVQQKAVILALEAEGLRDMVKVMVGGGAVTAEFARMVGADGYDPTAIGAVQVARRLVGA